MTRAKLLPMKYWLVLSLIAIPTMGFALTSDREKPIHVQADSATVDDESGTSIYRGNVIIDQGTLQITADEVEVLTANSEVIQVIASANPGGKLAHYEQQPDDSPEKVFADAKKITYLIQEDRLHLSGDARLKQEDDLFTGQILHYDITRGVVNLNSSGQAGDRINLTINPKAKSNNNSEQ